MAHYRRHTTFHLPLRRPLGLSIGKRTKLPFLNYEEKLGNLPEAPPIKNIYPPASPRAGSIIPKSPRALYNIVKAITTRHVDLKPGLNNSGYKTDCYPRFHKLIKGSPLEFDEALSH
jgi:hypothetical protein